MICRSGAPMQVGSRGAPGWAALAGLIAPGTSIGP